MPKALKHHVHRFISFVYTPLLISDNVHWVVEIWMCIASALLMLFQLCVFFVFFCFMLACILWFQRWINVWMQPHGPCFIAFGSLWGINSLTAWFHFTCLSLSLFDVGMKTISFVVHTCQAACLSLLLNEGMVQIACFNERICMGKQAELHIWIEIKPLNNKRRVLLFQTKNPLRRLRIF